MSSGRRGRSSRRSASDAAGEDPRAQERHQALMRVALELARRGQGRTSPNPAVGALLVRGGEIIASGFHAYAGADHAEVAALRKVDFAAAGCDLYSTLEPCDHHGRTGPCTEAILRAGIRRVFVGALDPNPIVSGRGLRRLERAGVEVRRGVLEAECTALNEAFNFAIVHRRPFVVLKAALSLDGRIATRAGDSKWISSELSRRRVHTLRDELDAVLVGVGTVLADDPLLTARLPGARSPVRVVLDSELRTPLQAKLVRTAREARTLILCTRRAQAKAERALVERGVEVVRVRSGGDGRVDLRAALQVLHARELSSVLVEGGAAVHGALVDARLVNKVVLFMAPILIGGEGALPAVGGRGAAKVSGALALERMSVESSGRDLVLSGYPR